ncbi:hypothetical protein BH10ACI3_BH10ACI3_01290 [soil metagenome]
MRKLQLITIALVCAAFLCSDTPAQAAKSADVKAIDTYCKSVDAIIKKRKTPELVFADISDYNDDAKSKWRKFASEKALEKFREKTETYTIAYVWRKNLKLAGVNFTLFSPSGDWTRYIYSYYREDGTLAKVTIEHRTFYGDYIMLQDIYFSAAGKVLRKTTSYKDLATKKPKKLSKEFLEDNKALMKDVDYYMTTGKLPFAHLLKKK